MSMDDPVLVHRIFGVLTLSFATLMLLKESDVLQRRWVYLAGGALLLLGTMLLLDPWLFHGGDFGEEGRQHVLQGSLLVAAGAFVLAWRWLRPDASDALQRCVMAVVLAALGVGFLWHEQHQTGDMLLQTAQHRVMGVTLLFAALLELVASFRWPMRAWARTGWTLVLMVFALQLILYVEVTTQPHTSHEAASGR